MKILVVFEYYEEKDIPNFSLTAIDSKRTAWAGNLLIEKFEISQYADIFYVNDREDLQKFDKSGLELKRFKPLADRTPGARQLYSDKVIRKILEWADAKRAWVYDIPRLVGPNRLKFDEFYNKLEWKNSDE